MLSSLVRMPGRCLGTALAIAALWGGVSSAQTIATVSNGRISASLGETGDVSGATPAVSTAGRFGVDLVSGGGLLTMATGVKQQSYVTVRIDGGPPTAGADAATQTAVGWDLIFGEVGTNAIDGGKDSQKTDQGEWVTVPTVTDSHTITAEWHTLPGGNSDTAYQIPDISIALKMRLVRDLVWYQFTIKNNSASSHTVALRFAQAYQLPTGTTTGKVSSSSLPLIGSETQINGSQVPSWWRVMTTDGAGSVGALLYPAGSPVASDVPIDRLAFGTGTHLVLPLWDFTPDPTVSITSTGNAALYLSAINLASGQSRAINAYFGVQHASAVFGNRLAGWVDGPVQLSLDLTQPAGSQLTPNPFAVTAAYSNLSTFDLSTVTATINLPAGLKLDTNVKAQQSVTGIKAGADGAFAWKVVPDGTGSGRLRYSVFFQAGSGDPGVRVTRDIDVPAVPSQFTANGVQMISLPYLFTDPDPYVALGLPSFVQPLVRWNESRGGYDRAASLYPGRGYWISTVDARPVITGANAVPTTSDFRIALSAVNDGWNQIGNPFLYSVKWGEIMVVNQDPSDAEYNTPITVQEAASYQRRWIKSSVWWWDSAQGYLWDTDFSTDLVPFTGYWVKAQRPNLLLIIPVPSTRAAKVSSARAAVLPSARDWRVRLVASSGGVSDGRAYIGVSATGSDTTDAGSVLMPPAPGDRVGLSVLRSVAGRSIAFAEDMRSNSAGRKVWDVVVTSPTANQQVTVSWPDAGAVSRTHELFVIDPATGKRTQMRQVSSITVSTGATGSRALQIVAEPRGVGMFRITTVSIASRAKGAAAIAFQVSASADVAVRVLKADGSPVRTLMTRAIAAGASTQLTWDYRDGKGVALPTGGYLIEIKGSSADGQSDRRIVPHLVTR